MANQLQIILQKIKENSKAKMSIKEFAKEIGVSRNTVHRWLKGTDVMTLENYEKAKEVLGIKDE